MDAPEPGPVGLLGSLRGFADGLLGSAHDRLDLLSVELQEEKYRLIQILIWISAIVLLALLTIVFVSFAVVILLWDTARLAAVATLGAVYLIALGGTIFGFRRYLKNQPKPFAGTLRELREDRECIQADN
jgi:uncharacterized membrane protein YqjE